MLVPPGGSIFLVIVLGLTMGPAPRTRAMARLYCGGSAGVISTSRCPVLLAHEMSGWVGCRILGCGTISPVKRPSQKPREPAVLMWNFGRTSPFLRVLRMAANRCTSFSSGYRKTIAWCWWATCASTKPSMQANLTSNYNRQGMRTARLEEIVRQKDPALKETVAQLAHGEDRDVGEKWVGN